MTENKSQPRPPEPHFYEEEPKRKFTFSFKRIRIGRWRKHFLLVSVAVLAMLALRTCGKVEPKRSGAVGERQETLPRYTASEVEKVIMASRSVSDKRPRVKEAAGPDRKRKLDTEVAVFIRDENTDRARDARSTRAEDRRLGLPAGTVIPAFLKQNVLSFNVLTPVIAEVSKDVAEDGIVLIPKGSQFMGEAEVLKTIDRINVRFDRLIFAKGSSVFREHEEMRVRAMAQSPGGPGGIPGLVDKYTDRKVLKAIGETLLAGTSLFVGGSRTDAYALEDQLRINLAQNLTDQAARDLRAVKVEKSITAKAFDPVEVILLESL